MSITDVPLAGAYSQVAQDATHLATAQILDQVRSLQSNDPVTSDQVSAHKEALEIGFRAVFVQLLAALEPEADNSYDPIWSLIDAATTLANHGCANTMLSFWLIEELLDSQTVVGCLRVFDYLETRREALIKTDFGERKLALLRCCNELLRRLSRAEDTVFCGRVFIYLFQCFPLGDKSAINMRGEFHTENKTSFNHDTASSNGVQGATDGSMDVDPPSSTEQNTAALDALYPRFWSMQTYFSSPTSLFYPDNMRKFKSDIEQTLVYFDKLAVDLPSASTLQDSDPRGAKRKHDDMDKVIDQDISTFNPKYLTNRDLFHLEIHDIDFRRHVLVQAMVLLDFLCSLTVQAKTKLSFLLGGKKSRVALYEECTLSEEDRLWAVQTRKSIEQYLETANGAEGRHYLRMVNMVLSRDRNWTMWKATGSQSFLRSSIDPQSEIKSQQALEHIIQSANVPLVKPKGSAQLDFLSHDDVVDALKINKTNAPSLDDFHKGILTDDLDLDFATEEEKKEIEERKAGKLWRALRSAHGKKFALCEDIKDGQNIDALIGKVPDETEKQNSRSTSEAAQNTSQSATDSKMEDATQ